MFPWRRPASFGKGGVASSHQTAKRPGARGGGVKNERVLETCTCQGLWETRPRPNALSRYPATVEKGQHVRAPLPSQSCGCGIFHPKTNSTFTSGLAHPPEIFPQPLGTLAPPRFRGPSCSRWAAGPPPACLCMSSLCVYRQKIRCDHHRGQYALLRVCLLVGGITGSCIIWCTSTRRMACNVVVSKVSFACKGGSAAHGGRWRRGSRAAARRCR